MKHNRFEPSDPNLYDVATHAPGPKGRLPLQADWLRETASGNLFGWTMDAAMGWTPSQLGRKEFLILSTQGGIRAADGTPIALGYHTGHWEIGMLAQAAAEELTRFGTIPFAGFVSDPCDGRTQGTPGMMDSLAYRNDAAIVFRRLIRSLPTRRRVLGIATCDKGLPAMMMALAAQAALPCVIVPGGVTLLPEQGEDAGQVQSLGESLEEWEHSERRRRLRERLRTLDRIDPDDVIMNPQRARERGLTSTVTFLTGNLAPEGAVVKSTAIDPSVVSADGVYRKISTRLCVRTRGYSRGERIERPHGQAGRRDRVNWGRSAGNGNTTFNRRDIKLSVGMRIFG